MADTIQLSAAIGVGAVLATEDEASVHYQKVKLTASGSGTTADLSFAEDTQHTSGDHGIMSLVVRNDTLAALGGTDGDYAPIQVNASGALYIQEGAALDVSAATVTVDWAGTAPPVGAGVEATALRVTVATDSTGVLSVDDNGGSLTVDNATISVVGGGTEATAQRVTLASDSTGVLSVDDNGAALTVDWAGTAPPIGAGVEATALRVTVATDSTGVLTVDDGGSSLTVDNATISVVGGGVEATAQRVTIASDSTGLLSVDDNGGSLTIDGTVTASSTTGNAAHDAAAAGNPVAIAARAAATVEALTQVAGADASFVTADLNGCLVTRNGTTLEELVSERTSNTDGAATALSGAFAAGGANIHAYITSACVHNAHATTNAYVDIRDGSAGSVLWTLPLPATGGSIQYFDPPLKFSANTAVAYDVSAAVTTVYLSFNGFFAQG